MKTKKLSLFLALIVALVASITMALISFLPKSNSVVDAATIVQPTAYKGNSVSFANNTIENPMGYQLDSTLTGVPKTFEVFVKVPTTVNAYGSRYGVIVGNYYNGKYANRDCFDIEIYAGGRPRLFWYNPIGNSDTDANRGNKAQAFSWILPETVTVNTNKWTHLAFVRDTVNDKTYCYINGELVGTLDNAGTDMTPGTLAGSVCGNLSIAQDNRNQNDTETTYFQGNIAYVALSSTIKTQAQIKESMSNMSSCKATESQGNLLFLNYASLNYDGEGLDTSNANGYGIQEGGLTAVPKTFEALINVNTFTKHNYSDYKGYGVIIGNFYSGAAANSDCFDFEVHANGNPRLYWYNSTASGNDTDGTSKGFDWKVTNVNLNTGKWTHLAFVRDTAKDKTYCYVNGYLVNTLNNAGSDMIPGTWSGSKAGGLKVGQDSREEPQKSNLIRCFQGQIGYVAISSTAKTATQIQESMKLMEAGAVNKDMTKSVADLLLVDKSAVRSYYRAERAFDATPNTITATFKLPKAYSVGFNGALFGNVAIYASSNSINLELNAKGHLCVVWNAHKRPNANPWIEFSQDFRTGEWTTVAVVRDKTANCFKLYVNGVYKESSSTSTGVGADITGTYAPAIGTNFATNTNERILFRGYVKDVAVFSTALSASDVSAFCNATDKTKLSKTNYPSMMLNWVLNSKQQSLYYNETETSGLIDYSGNGNDAYLCSSQNYCDIVTADEDWFVAGEDEYTLIFMPDTQITCSRDIQYYENNANVKTIADLDMTKTFQWMVDNKDAMNLSFVMHMGDLKHARGVSENWAAQNDWREWQLISGKSTYNSAFNTGTAATYSFSSSFINGQKFGFELLKEAGVPYTVVVGNHDYNAFQMGAGTGRHADYFNYYFSKESYNEKFAQNVVARYDRNATKWAKNNDTMMNVIYEMTATPKGSSTPIKYLVISFEFGPTDDMIDWACEIISQSKYSSHRVIVTTHALMYSDGEFMGNQASWNPDTYTFSNTEEPTNNGQQIYDKLIKCHDNVFMSSGGHVSQETLMWRTDRGDFNNQIFSTLVDWQDTFSSRGDSLLLVAKVNEKTQKITFNVYNPVTNQFYLVENRNMEYDFSDALYREVTKETIDINYTGTSEKVGDTVEFSINKTQGFVYCPTVTDALGNDIEVTQVAENSYTFTMPMAKVTIGTEFKDMSSVTLPTSMNLEVGDTKDLSTYLPSGNDYTLSINGSSVTAQGLVITATSGGVSTITISIDGYGTIAECVVTVKEVQSSSSSSSTSSNESSSSSSIVSTSSSSSSSSKSSSSSSSSSSSLISSSSISSTSSQTSKSSSSESSSEASSEQSSSEQVSVSQQVSTSQETSSEVSSEISSEESSEQTSSEQVSLSQQVSTSQETSSEVSSEVSSEISSEQSQESSETSEVTSVSSEVSTAQSSSKTSKRPTVSKSSQEETRGGCGGNIVGLELLSVLAIISLAVVIKKSKNH